MTTNPTSAHILMIVDRSGSMDEIKSDAEGGVNNFLDGQRDLHNADGEKIDVTISLAHFDHEFEWLARNDEISDIERYTLVPRGMTALLDAIGRGVNEDAELLAQSDTSPDKVVCVIVTDGIENDSHEWTDSQVKKLIETQKNEHGWEFQFLAKDITTIQMGRDIGMETTQFSGTRAGTRAAYAATSQNVSSYLSGKSTRVDNPDVVSDPS